jgi:hypothetical protein
MNIGKLGNRQHSPYVAFKDDRQRKWALISRDIRLILMALFFALANAPATQWQNLWKFMTGG